jgi:hypothetical protein
MIDEMIRGSIPGPAKTASKTSRKMPTSALVLVGRRKNCIV